MSFINPMLASALPEGKTVADYQNGCWVAEEKYDGHRLILRTAEVGYKAWSRNGKERVLPPHLVEAIKSLPPDCTFDGELFIPGGVSTDVTALHLQHKLHLVLFDMLVVNNISAMARPGAERRELLLAAFEHVGIGRRCLYPAEQFSPSSEGLESIWARGGEGAVLKRTMTVYRPGKRTNDWVKFKRLGAAEVTIVGFEAGLLGPYSVILCMDDDGVATQVKALNDEWRASILGPHLVGTRMVISYTEKHRSGNYREPRADHLLED